MKHRNAGAGARRFALFSGLAAAVLAAGIAWQAGAQAAGEAAIQITPSSGPYGTVTVITGQNFAAHEQVAIYKGTRPFFAYETDASGSFVGQPHPLIGPGPVSGIITINAIGRTSGLKAMNTFTVTTK